MRNTHALLTDMFLGIPSFISCSPAPLKFRWACVQLCKQINYATLWLNKPSPFTHLPLPSCSRSIKYPFNIFQHKHSHFHVSLPLGPAGKWSLESLRHKEIYAWQNQAPTETKTHSPGQTLDSGD